MDRFGMDRFAWGPRLLAVAVLMLCALAPATAGIRVNPGGIMIDVDTHPPAIGIGDGAVIIFVRRVPLVGSEVHVLPDPSPGGPRFIPVQVLPAPEDSAYNVVQAYLVKGPGTATFTITYKPVPPASSAIDHVEIDVPDIH